MIQFASILIFYQDTYEYRSRLAEIGILAEFLTQIRTYDDLEEALRITYSKYETHMIALDPRSEVAVFFAEHGLSYFAQVGVAPMP